MQTQEQDRVTLTLNVMPRPVPVRTNIPGGVIQIWNRHQNPSMGGQWGGSSGMHKRLRPRKH